MNEEVGPSAERGGGNSEFGKAEPTVKQAEPPPEYLTKKQLAKHLQISETTIDNRINPKSRWHCPDFPEPRVIGIGPYAAQRWLRHEVDAYVLSRPTKFFPRTR